MKMTILKTSILAIILATSVTACSNSPEDKAEKVQEEKKDLTDAKNEFYKAIQDSIADYNSFKIDGEAKIKEFENKIAELKLTVQLEKNPLKTAQENLINEFEVKSSKLKSSINDYNETGKDNWDAFKSRFKYEMDELEKSIAELSKKVVK
jgi:hypothetical protein